MFSPAARPRTKAVFPAPSSPNSRTTAPADKVAASARPTASVSSSESVVREIATLFARRLGGLPPGRQLEDGVPDVAGDVGGRHRDFAVVGLGEITGHPVQVN